MDESQAEISLLRLVAARLERLSADSKWAHRASGVRGQVLRTLDSVEAGETMPPPGLQDLLDIAFEILRAAARDIA